MINLGRTVSGWISFHELHKNFRRFRSDFAGAAEDLTEVLEIAERGPMRLHECDAHLEWTRLCRD
jgi:hypothetical protein